jgi:hypothetical protein
MQSCLCETLAVSVPDAGFCCGNHARKTHESVEVSPDPLISEVGGVTAESHVLSALISGKALQFPLDILREAPNLPVFSNFFGSFERSSVQEMCWVMVGFVKTRALSLTGRK